MLFETDSYIFLLQSHSGHASSQIRQSHSRVSAAHAAHVLGGAFARAVGKLSWPTRAPPTRQIMDRSAQCNARLPDSGTHARELISPSQIAKSPNRQVSKSRIRTFFAAEVGRLVTQGRRNTRPSGCATPIRALAEQVVPPRCGLKGVFWDLSPRQSRSVLAAIQWSRAGPPRFRASVLCGRVIDAGSHRVARHQLEVAHKLTRAVCGGTRCVGDGVHTDELASRCRT